jgi:hypothetical protein
VTLDLFNDVFLLHFALETAKRIFEGLSLLQSDFRQLDTPPNWSRLDPIVIASFLEQVKNYIQFQEMKRGAHILALYQASKNQSQSDLHLSRSVSIAGSYRVSRHLVVSWEMIDSKLFSSFDKPR